MNPAFLRTICALALVAGAANAAPTPDHFGVDPAIDPCADFYGYVNHRWIAATAIPADRARWGSFDELEQRNERSLSAALEELRAHPAPAGTPQRKAVDFYASGMDVAAIEAAGLAPLQELLERIDALRAASELPALLARLHAHGVGAGFDFAVRPDSKDSEHWMAQFIQGGIGLPERDYYFRDDARSVELRAKYLAHVTRMLELSGEGAEAAAADARAVMEIETALANASMTVVERRDVERTYHPMTLADLEREAPGFAWRKYARGIGARDSGRINVAQPAFAREFARLAAATPVSRWRGYLRWYTLHATARALPDAFSASHFEFYEKALRGTAVRFERSREVMEIIGGRYGTEPMAQAMAMVFVDRNFPREAKARAEALIAGIKAALRERLAVLDWMGAQTRARALAKVDSMRIKAGYPDKWRDYSDADVGRYPFVENWLRAKAYDMRRDVARIGTAVDHAEWFAAPHIVNAFYNRFGNEIVFPAGILQPPFFDANADDAVNYGGIGAVVGHEITHGFDDNGRRFDARGNLTDWWTADDARRYVERADRVQRQYDAFAGVDDIHVNGKLTLGENISDVGGTKIAYLAMQRALAGGNPGRIEGLTPEQRFFLAYAVIWRANARPEYERLQLRTDGHSPPRFRVAGVIANMPEFAQAFSCKAGPVLSEGERANIW